MQLNPALAALKTRLETQAQLDEDGSLPGALLRSRFLSQGGLTTYNMLAPNPVVSIATAARSALKEINWVASREEEQEEVEAAKRVRLVLARKEVEEGAYAQALMLAHPERGIGVDGSMGQCFYCNNCEESEVICCDGCISVFHRRCLHQRGVEIDEAEPLLCCPVCVERESAERDPSKQSVLAVLALTARGTVPRVDFEAAPPLVPQSPTQPAPRTRPRPPTQPAPTQPARRTRPRLNEAAAAPGTSLTLATLTPELTTVSHKP